MKYEAGDLVLFNAKENPTDHLGNKLDPNWLGPYEVIHQAKNNVRVKHLVLMHEKEFFVGRLKPFWGTYEEGYNLAKLDRNQFIVTSINYYRGNPHKRTSMEFNITFEDGDTLMVKYNLDLADSYQYGLFIDSKPELFLLRFRASEGIKEMANIKKLAITDYKEKDSAYLNLRFYDGMDSEWFDNLSLPSPEKSYYVRIIFQKFMNTKKTKIKALVLAFSNYPFKYVELNEYDICTMVVKDLDFERSILITDNHGQIYPQMFQV